MRIQQNGKPETQESLASNMTFGAFMAPIHPPGASVARQLDEDLDFVVRMDELGFDEVLFGEHHTGGHEIYTSPELMIATAAERTKRIRLGTGVSSLPYRHPLIVADMIAQLDHITKGRVILGVGPGALPGDARMMGIDYKGNRRRMEEAMDVIMHLFTSDEPLTVETDWFKLEEGLLHYKTFQRPHPEMLVAAVGSPGGPRVAGKFGLPLLSLTGNNEDNVKIISEHWKILESRSEEFGHPVASRSKWRLVGPMHIAETREQAEREVEHGLDLFMRYFFRLPVTFFQLKDDDGNVIEDASPIEIIRGTGFGVIGTPDDAIAHIERLQEGTGGFGTFLLQSHDWANPEATHRSIELFSKYVMPRFQDGIARREARWEYDAARLNQIVTDIKEGMSEAQSRHSAEYGGASGVTADILT